MTLEDPFSDPSEAFGAAELQIAEDVVFGDAPQAAPNPLACPACEQVFGNRAGLGSHMAAKHGLKAPPAPRKPRKPPKDKAPPSVTINLGGEKKGKDPVLDTVEERARQLAGLCAMLVLTAGQAEDAGDIMKGSEAWAKAVRDLAVYEKWLRELASGGEATGRTIAWVTVIMATVGMVLPILLRHQVLPQRLASGLQAGMGIHEAMSGTAQAAGTPV
jgi:hypothetical protein